MTAQTVLVPYYQSAGVTLYHGDCRDVLPQLRADAIVTDPVWPDCEHVFPGIDAAALFGEALAVADVARVVVQIGCASDPRFLGAVPTRWPFLRVCWLEYAVPSYQGRILNSGDVAYAFGEPPLSAPGRRVLPGKFTSTRTDPGMVTRNWDPATRSKRGVAADAKLHVAPRKLAHVRWLVNWFGGASVIDPFCGSGTTLLAARECGVRAVGIEIEERHCETAARRLEHQDVLPLFEESAS